MEASLREEDDLSYDAARRFTSSKACFFTRRNQIHFKHLVYDLVYHQKGRH